MTIASSFVKKYLDPATSLTEVLFGVIMTLTFTLGAGLTIREQGAAGARELLIATLGCNTSWGVIDGVFYILGQLFERARRRRVAQMIQRASRDTEAFALVGDELDDIIETVLAPEERKQLYGRIVTHIRSREIPPNRITRDDLMGAVASFCLVFLASLPAAIPFVLISDARLALRVSNGVLLALLFISGVWWARYTTARPGITGLILLLFGTALVAMTIALGG